MKIAIASGKGGTGKTTLASNLASFLANDFKVVLTDLDVEEPNSGLFIKADFTKVENKFKMIPEWDETKCDACGICQEVCNFNAILQLGSLITVFPELCHGCYACSELCPTSALPMIPKKIGELKQFEKNNFVFIESRLRIGEEQAAPLIKQTIDYVDEHFDDNTLKIYDSPPGTSCPVIEATKNADFVILVTEPTPFGFHDLKLAIETMKKLGKFFGVVINRDDVGNDDVLNYCNKENIDVIARIPQSREIAELYSKGELLYSKVPEVHKQLELVKSYIFDVLNAEAK